ncbi:MAG: helix-turn-helix domain-containing protein [Chitinophagaceae bacterium]|jgi:AraC-like DNA-binding protein|nr:MAG: helix-turn-helix domain-containing protein [Chitinophagaceae bacterium]
MNYQNLNIHTNGEFRFSLIEKPFKYSLFNGKDKSFYSIAYNKGQATTVLIDEVPYSFEEQMVLPLMANQTFSFQNPQDVLIWQFNREFYCISNHDAEVGCVGFLFHGSSGTPFVQLNEEERLKLARMIEVFKDEFETRDNIQTEMLLSLLKRLIIFVTRIAKIQFIDSSKIDDVRLYTIRHYNLLVEIHFRTHHDVGFYANELNKSPKTLSNLFSLYNHKSPQQVIHERLIVEARRLLYYTDKSVKEIAYELGFEDAAYFSNFFKKNMRVSPSDFKRNAMMAV